MLLPFGHVVRSCMPRCPFCARAPSPGLLRWLWIAGEKMEWGGDPGGEDLGGTWGGASGEHLGASRRYLWGICGHLRGIRATSGKF